MIKTNDKLQMLQGKEGKYVIMILGLGSVGGYLLQYLCDLQNPKIEIVVAGRSFEKLESDVNIITISAMIRNKLKSKVLIEGGCDLEDVCIIERCLEKYKPDIIVNTSRVYSGLKYGSISWTKFRAYGIWAPLAIKYIRNIMEAVEKTKSDAIVINTSYSDVIIPWLKSADKAYPDFGSGNLNHLVPRIRRAASCFFNIEDFWNIDVILATGHFHDVVISKEGQNEGIEQLINVSYQGKELIMPQSELLKACMIAMPTDAKRNMMNASSNFDIITAIFEAIAEKKKKRIHSPGVFGNIGGFPVILDGTNNQIKAYIDESCFSMEQMAAKNKQSIALDGIEDINNGCLYYTDKLIDAVEAQYHIQLPKQVSFDKIDDVAEFLISKIINNICR